MSKQPSPLKAGDTIGVMSPSSRIDRADLDAACALLSSKGYRVAVHPQTIAYSGPEHGTQYAGTVEEKIRAFHDFLRDPNINAIFFATGGQRSAILIDHLDFKLITANPKIIMGFSDNTALLNAITARTGIETWHGPTLRRMMKNPQLDFNLSLLSGTQNDIVLSGAKILQDGTAKGILIGGNLSVFASLHKADCAEPKRSILFFEDIGEELTTIDRHLISMRRSGLLEKASGLIFGQFTDSKDTGTPFGLGLEDIIREHTTGFKGPILMNAPFGHDADLFALPIGRVTSLKGAVLTI